MKKETDEQIAKNIINNALRMAKESNPLEQDKKKESSLLERGKEFNFINEIKKIPINNREQQIIKIVEEKFKEFIKKLKEEIPQFLEPDNYGNWNDTDFHGVIDELAGDKLITK